MLGVSPAPQRAAKPKSVSRMRGGCSVSSSALSSFRSRCAMWCRWQNATVLMNCLKKNRALACAQSINHKHAGKNPPLALKHTCSLSCVEDSCLELGDGLWVTKATTPCEPDTNDECIDMLMAFHVGGLASRKEVERHLSEEQAVFLCVFVLVGDVAGEVAAESDVHEDRQILVRHAHLRDTSIGSDRLTKQHSRVLHSDDMEPLATCAGRRSGPEHELNAFALRCLISLDGAARHETG